MDTKVNFFISREQMKTPEATSATEMKTTTTYGEATVTEDTAALVVRVGRSVVKLEKTAVKNVKEFIQVFSSLTNILYNFDE